MALKEILNVLGGGLFKEVRKLVDDVVTTKEEKLAAQERITRLELEFQQKQDELELERYRLDTDIAKGQIETNKIEAGSKSLFVAGWRPFIGWICGVSLAYSFIIQPLLLFILRAAGNNMIPPELDGTQLTTILLGILGLAGYRTYEKKQGVASETLSKA